MKFKILSIVDTPIKKVGLAVLCGAIAASISVAAIAASGPHSLAIKVDNGVKSYSTDEGQNWSQTAPDGVTVNQDGSVRFKDLTPPENAKDAKDGILLRNDNGVRSYSTDGGKTWTEGVPNGVTVTQSEDGKLTEYYEAK
jgi:hypothetical protein